MKRDSAPAARLPTALLHAGAACMLLALAPGPSALAQAPPSSERVPGGMFDASDPPGLTRFMSALGYAAELTRDGEGQPLIRGRVSRTDYVIQFYECENRTFCNSVQFAAAAPAIATAALEGVNAFNSRWRYGRASLDGAELRLQFDVNLDAGVTASNLEDTLDIWRRLVEIFERELLGLPDPASSAR